MRMLRVCYAYVIRMLCARYVYAMCMLCVCYVYAMCMLCVYYVYAMCMISAIRMLLNFIFTGLHGNKITSGSSTKALLFVVEDGDTCCTNPSLSNA